MGFRPPGVRRPERAIGWNSVRCEGRGGLRVGSKGPHGARGCGESRGDGVEEVSRRRGSTGGPVGGLAGTASREVVLVVAVSVVLVVVVLGAVESPGEMELSTFPGGGYQWVGRWWGSRGTPPGRRCRCRRRCRRWWWWVSDGGGGDSGGCVAGIGVLRPGERYRGRVGGSSGASERASEWISDAFSFFTHRT